MQRRSLAVLRAAGLATAATLAAPSLHAQSISVAPGVVAPGGLVTATITNDTAGFLSFPDGCGLQVLTSDGDLVGSPFKPAFFCDALYALDPGQSQAQVFAAPSEPGEYVVVFLYGGRAAARIVVGAGAPSAEPDLCFYPTGIDFPQTAHEHDFTHPEKTTWEFANTGAGAHAFGAGDELRMLLPGWPIPVATLPLAGISVDAGGVTSIELPTAALVPGPHTVVASWNDPGTGTFVESTGGIRLQGTRVDLHMPDGNELAPGGTLRASIAMLDFPDVAGQEPFAFVAVGLAPGSVALPDGNELPLTLDPIVLASFVNGFGGLIANFSSTVPNTLPAGGFFGYYGTKEDATFTHPGIPGLAGLRLRMAVLAFDPAKTVWGTSQPEEIIFQ